MKNLILIFFGILFFTACDQNTVYEEYKNLDDLKWARSEKFEFTADIKDPSIKYDQIIAVRHAEGFPYKNLRVKVTRTSPEGKVLEKEYDLQLAGEDNMWKGSGMGDIYDLEVPVEENIAFAKAGEYTYRVEHTMQQDELPLVMEVGLIIRKKQEQE